MPPIIDITGNKYGMLTVLERGQDQIISGHNYTRWKCLCDCGNYKLVLGSKLKNGKTKSCGCSKKELISKSRLNDLTGQTFGRLTVLQRSEDIIQKSGKNTVIWKCKCECGHYTYVRTQCLCDGATRSCGCYHNELLSQIRLIDLVGKTFGQLTVIQRVQSPDDRRPGIYWKATCKCGNMVVVNGQQLRGNKTMSCGCAKASNGQMLVEKYLKDHEIKYIYQYTYNDCRDKKKLPFDFYLPQYNAIIQYDGIQHFYDEQLFRGKSVENIHRHDKIKNEYCQRNKIYLLRIKYTQNKNIDHVLSQWIQDIKNMSCNGVVCAQ